ncbi:MAG: OmpH family outer membrane protein [Bacillota bacterium]
MNKKYLYLIIFAAVLIIVGGLLYSFTPLGNMLTGNNSQEEMVYVDMQELFNSHPRRYEAEEELNELVQSMQQKLEEQAEDISGEEQQEMLQEYQSELSEREQELIQEILDDVEQAIDKVAAEEDYELVLERRNVVYGGNNITDIVLDYITDGEEDVEEGENETPESGIETEDLELETESETSDEETDDE